MKNKVLLLIVLFSVTIVAVVMTLRAKESPTSVARKISPQERTPEATPPKPRPGLSPAMPPAQIEQPALSFQDLEQIENLRKAEIQKFLTRLDDGNISLLEMSLWKDQLSICLSDPVARSRFKEWLLNNARADRNNLVYLKAALESANGIDPSIVTEIASQGCKDGNWTAVATAMRIVSASTPSHIIKPILEKTFQDGDDLAVFFAAKTLINNGGGGQSLHNMFSAEECAQFLKPAFSKEIEDTGTKAMLYFAMGDHDLIQNEEFDLLHQRFENAQDSPNKYLSYAQIMKSFGNYWAGQTDSTTLAQRLTAVLDYTLIAVEDPDPLIRLGAYLQYQHIKESVNKYLRQYP